MYKFRLITIMLLSTVLLLSCETIKLPCERVENGIKIKEYAIVQKHPEKQFQQVVKTTNFNINATIDVLEKVKIGDLDIGTKTQIIELRQRLNQYSSRFQDILKAAYNAYNGAACDKEVRMKYLNILADMDKENVAIEKLRVEIEKEVAKEKNKAGVLPNAIDVGKIKQSLNAYNLKKGEHPIINLIDKNPEYNQDSLIEINKIFLSAIKVSNMLYSLKNDTLQSNINFDSELINNVRVIETNYRKTGNCDITHSLIEFIDYYISVNENKETSEILKNINDYKTLKKYITDNCK